MSVVTSDSGSLSGFDPSLCYWFGPIDRSTQLSFLDLGKCWYRISLQFVAVGGSNGYLDSIVKFGLPSYLFRLKDG
jgi:hypothetical protein